MRLCRFGNAGRSRNLLILFRRLTKPIAMHHKNRSRRTLVLSSLVALTALLSHAPVFAGPELAQRESDLRETLLDICALIRSGINLNQLRERLPEVTIKFDRYVRSGGEAYGSLHKVVSSLRDLEADWTENVQYEMKAIDFLPEDRMKLIQILRESRQLHMQSVIKSMAKYEDERKAASEAVLSKPKKTNRKPQ